MALFASAGRVAVEAEAEGEGGAAKEADEDRLNGQREVGAGSDGGGGMIMDEGQLSGLWVFQDLYEYGWLSM